MNSTLERPRHGVSTQNDQPQTATEPAPPPVAPTRGRRRARPGDVEHFTAGLEADLKPEQRIIQADGRRYSIKLEVGFWNALRRIADDRRMRLNRLISAIAREPRPTGNFSSALRVFCLHEMEQRLAHVAFAASKTSLLTLAGTAPAPCLVLAANQQIAAMSPAFAAWFGEGAESLIGRPVLRHFRFRAKRQFEAMWNDFARGQMQRESAHIIHFSTGRVLTASVQMVPVETKGKSRFMCAVWLLR